MESYRRCVTVLEPTMEYAGATMKVGKLEDSLSKTTDDLSRRPYYLKSTICRL